MFEGRGERNKDKDKREKLKNLCNTETYLFLWHEKVCKCCLTNLPWEDFWFSEYNLQSVNRMAYLHVYKMPSTVLVIARAEKENRNLLNPLKIRNLLGKSYTLLNRVSQIQRYLLTWIYI